MAKGKVSIDSLLKKRDEVYNLIQDKTKELEKLDTAIGKFKLTKLEDLLSQNDLSFDDLTSLIQSNNHSEQRKANSFENRVSGASSFGSASDTDEKENKEDEI